MIRLFYLGLAGMLTFVPLMVVWAAERPRPAAVSRPSTYGRTSNTVIYHSGGRGGWLGNSYGWGHGGGSGSANSGGSSGFRGGGPGGGGK